MTCCRYLVSHRDAVLPQWVTETLKQRFSDLDFATPNPVEANPARIDNSRLGDLGLQLRSPSETLIDMAVTLIVLGIASPRTL